MLIDFKIAENVFIQMNAHYGLACVDRLFVDRERSTSRWWITAADRELLCASGWPDPFQRIILGNWLSERILREKTRKMNWFFKMNSHGGFMWCPVVSCQSLRWWFMIWPYSRWIQSTGLQWWESLGRQSLRRNAPFGVSSMGKEFCKDEHCIEIVVWIFWAFY